jgi:Rod binding domain-containing protein
VPQVGQIISANAAESLAQARSEQVLRQAKEHAASGDTKLENAARSFEAILLNKWLQDAEKSFATVPGEDPDKEHADPGTDQFRSLAFQAVAESITASGGIGIASMIVKQMSRTGAHAEESPQATDSTETRKTPPRVPEVGKR